MAAYNSTPIGAQFFRLTVIGSPFRDKHGGLHVKCLCVCGAETSASCEQLVKSRKKSCGCFRKEFRRLEYPAPIGERFGKLVVLRDAPHMVKPRGVTALCDCGTIKDYVLPLLRYGNTKSCGCLRVDETLSRVTHGHARRVAKSRTYNSWAKMIVRCTKPSNLRWADWGGRGISVCDRWFKFENFLADMGDAPPKLTLDRFPDVNGNYEPSNCRWASYTEQANNTRRNHFVEFNGRNMTIAQWSRETGIPPKVIHQRLVEYKWSIERALTEPKREYPVK